MNYPIWDVPLTGGGLLIAAIAVVHVFISHFAIGGGLFLVLTERMGLRARDAAVLEYARHHTNFLTLVILVFGAVTGVGVWWTIALVNPTAVSALVHLFAWVWAIEWVFFLVEIVAALVYRYGWGRMDARTHQAVGWVYFGSAWLSLLMINGILTFMLTSGKWPETQSLTDAWMNPGMLPSLAMRSAVCVALAGVYALITSSQLADLALKERMVRYSAKWVIVGAGVIPFAGLWFAGTLPEQARFLASGGTPMVTAFTVASVLLSGLLITGTVFGPMLFPRQTHVTFACVLAALALGATGATEWVREAVRKPYVIYEYMYSNSLRPADLADVSSLGLLASSRWHVPAKSDWNDPVKIGRSVFRVQCSSCHTVSGLNSIRFATRGWDKALLDQQIQYLNTLKGAMPPFIGTDEERGGLVAYLISLQAEGPGASAALPARSEGERLCRR